MHIDILILVKALSKFLMYDITFIFYADIATDRELKTSTLMRRWSTLMWRRTTSKYRRSASVDKNVADPKVLTSWQQDQHLIDTDKLNSVTDYKWIVLYFIS